MPCSGRTVTPCEKIDVTNRVARQSYLIAPLLFWVRCRDWQFQPRGDRCRFCQAALTASVVADFRPGISGHGDPLDVVVADWFRLVCEVPGPTDHPGGERPFADGPQSV